MFLNYKTPFLAGIVVACLALNSGATQARAAVPWRDPDQTHLASGYALDEIGGPVNRDALPSGRYILILSGPSLSEDDAPGARGPAGLALRRAAIAVQQAKASAALAAVAPRATVERSFRMTLNALVVRANGDDPAVFALLPGVASVWAERMRRIALSDSVELIGAPTVWATLDGMGNPVDGRGMRIAILDTGIDYTHPDLGGCLGPTCKVITGYNATLGNWNVLDLNGHGTHVAGIAAANGGLKGVAPGASLLAYTVCNVAGACADADVIEGLERAADPDGNGDPADHVDVANLSLGGPGSPDDALSQAVDHAVDLGMLVVVAAGNDGPRYLAVGSPGVARKALTVGATSKTDRLATFSARGPVPAVLEDLKPDLVAPGAQITSTVSAFGQYGNPSRYANLSGTSMAAPHAAGAAALVRQAHPDWTALEIKSALMNTGLDIGLTPFEQGSGRLQVDRAAPAAFIASPGSLGYGAPRMGGSAALSLTLRNVTTLTQTINLSATAGLVSNGVLQPLAPATPVSAPVLSAYSVMLAPGANATVMVTLVIANDSAEGYYAGAVFASGGGRMARIPLAYALLSQVVVRVIDVDGLEWIDDFGAISLIQPNERAARFAAPGMPITAHVASGLYNVHAFARGSAYYAGTLYPGAFITPLVLMTQTVIAPNSATDIDLRAADAAVVALDTRDPAGDPTLVHNWRAAFAGPAYTASLNVSSIDFTLPGALYALPAHIPMRISPPAPGVTLSLGFNAYGYTRPMSRFVAESARTGLIAPAAAALTSWADEALSLDWAFAAGDPLPGTLGLSSAGALTRETRLDAHGAAPVAQYAGASFAAGEFISLSASGVFGGRIPGAQRTLYTRGGGLIRYLEGDTLAGRQTTIGASGSALLRLGGMSIYPAVTFSSTAEALLIGTPLFGTDRGGLLRWGEAASLTLSLDGSPIGTIALCETRGKCAERATESMLLAGPGQYRVMISSTHATGIGRLNRVEAGFVLPAADPRPPVVTGLDLPQRYLPNAPLSFTITISGAGWPVTQAEGRYSLDEGASWAPLTVTLGAGGYLGALDPAGAPSVSLAFTVTDQAGNWLAWETIPAAQRAIPVTLTATAEATALVYGDLTQSVRVSGTLAGRSALPAGLIALPIVATANGRRIGLIFQDAGGAFDARLPIVTREVFDAPGDGVLRLEFDAMLYAPSSVDLPLRAFAETSRLMLPRVGR
ncbi:MAG: S8 family serine peptidase [Thermoflexales bacterium]